MAEALGSESATDFCKMRSKSRIADDESGAVLAMIRVFSDWFAAAASVALLSRKIETSRAGKGGEEQKGRLVESVKYQVRACARASSAQEFLPQGVEVSSSNYLLHFLSLFVSLSVSLSVSLARALSLSLSRGRVSLIKCFTTDLGGAGAGSVGHSHTFSAVAAA